MADSPKQPTTPPMGTSPAKGTNNANKDSWDGWHQHGNKNPQEALKDKHTNNPVNPSTLSS